MTSYGLISQPASSPRIASPVPDSNLLEIDPGEFRATFNRSAFMFRHNLNGHPLLNLARLIKLATTLPEEHVEYNAGDLPVSIDYWKTPRTGLSVEETIRRIEDCCSWMVLKRVEHDPEYKKLLDDCLDEVEPLSELLEPGMYERAGSIFISSPGAVTPYHMDHEINFLLQVRGSKTIHTFDRWDRSVLSEQALERYFCSATIDRNMELSHESERKAKIFELRAGCGLHIPTTSPHFVRNGRDVSISMSVAFQTRETDRCRSVRNFNAALRRLSLNPSPYGRSRIRDTVKCYSYRALRRAGLLADPER